jgi:hypothetical protein
VRDDSVSDAAERVGSKLITIDYTAQEVAGWINRDFGGGFGRVVMCVALVRTEP